MNRPSRTITIKPEARPITYLDKQGVEQQLGNVVAEDYNREVRRFLFEPVTSNPWANESKKYGEYVLGAGSKSMGFINPADVQRPILNAGWKIQDQVAYKGGLMMRTTFIAEDRSFQDPIDYDLEFWSNRKEMGKMFPSITVDTCLQIGRVAARISAGIYRLLCTNGLVSSVMGLASLSFNHVEWDPAVLEESIDGLGAGDINQLIRGPEISRLSSIARAVKIIRRYRAESDSETGLSAPMKYLNEHFKSISPNVVKPWAIDAYLNQLDMYVQCYDVINGANRGLDTKPVYAVDLINAYTSGVNHRRMESGNDRGIWSALSEADSVVKTTAALANYADVFSQN